jgi:hypothetical protein
MSKSADFPNEEREINGKTYKVSRLPNRLFIQLYTLSARMLGPALSLLIKEGGLSVDKILSLSGESLSGAIYELTSTANETDYNKLFGLMHKCSFCDGSIITENHWPHHIGNLIPFIMFFMEVQFRDFFLGAANVGPDSDPNQKDD